MSDEVLDAIKKAQGETPQPDVSSQPSPAGGDEVLQAIQKAGPAPALGEVQPSPAPTPTEQPPAPEKPITSWSEVPSAAAQHLVPSAIATGEAMVQPFIHPIQTYENLRDLGHGILQKAGIMSGQEDTGRVDAVMDYFAKRYGGMEQLRNTMGTDPVGFATDAATIMTGGEAALARATGVIGKTAEIAGKVGRTVEPMAVPRAIGRGVIPGGADARALSEAGVSMTPGQMTGGFGKAVEDMATSIPWLGSWIRSGRVRSVESFNKAVANQVLDPIGETVGRKTMAGHDLVAEVGDKLSEAYGRVTPNLKWTPDAQYRADIDSILRNDLPLMPKAQQDQFIALMVKKAPPPGAPFKEAESTISAFANKYMHSSVASERDLGQSANKMLIAMRENLARTNPTQAAELTKINSAYAMFTRMRNAAARGEEGVFTPNQLLGAVKAGDKSIGKNSFARGDALMQTFAELGQRVLPSKVPTSGTTERAAMLAALFGEGVLYSPHIAAGVATGMLPYTRAGMAATNAAFRAGTLARKPFTYLPRGTSYQLGKMDETQQDAYDRAKRLFPP